MGEGDRHLSPELIRVAESHSEWQFCEVTTASLMGGGRGERYFHLIPRAGMIYCLAVELSTKVSQPELWTHGSA